MATAHDLSNLVEANIIAIYQDYDPTSEAHDVAHGNIYRKFLHNSADITKQYIHMYGEYEMPVAAIDDLAGEVDSVLRKIISRPHRYAAHTSNLVDAERHLANHRDEVSEAYKARGGGDAASDPVSAVDAWNKECAEEVTQYWDSKIDWFYNSLIDL